MGRVFLIRVAGLAFALAAFAVWANDCAASRHHCGYRGYHGARYARYGIYPGASYHIGRSYYWSYRSVCF